VNDLAAKGIAMAQTKLARALALVRDLDREQLRQVQRAVAEQLALRAGATPEDLFEHAILESGLVKEIKIPPPRDESKRPLVEIKGKPLSETIIEERR
jgi:hypothetical protein